jgi:hypothetical protein
MLYEVAMLEHPTKKQAEEGVSERLVVGPITVVARDPQAAAVAAVLTNKGKIDAEEITDLSRLEVLVRPFAE